MSGGRSRGNKGEFRSSIMPPRLHLVPHWITGIPTNQAVFCPVASMTVCSGRVRCVHCCIPKVRDFYLSIMGLLYTEALRVIPKALFVHYLVHCSLLLSSGICGMPSCKIDIWEWASSQLARYIRNTWTRVIKLFTMPYNQCVFWECSSLMTYTKGIQRNFSCLCKSKKQILFIFVATSLWDQRIQVRQGEIYHGQVASLLWG